MKRFFALSMVFALLLCFAMPLSAKASIVNHDNDVGWQQPQPTATFAPVAFVGTDLNADHSATLTEMLTSLPLTALIPDMVGVVGQRAKLHVYWEGGTTKASLCKAEGGVKISNQVLNCNHRRFVHWRHGGKA